VGESGAEVIPFMIDKNLGFVFKPPECLAVNNPLPVALIFCSVGVAIFFEAASSGLR